MSRNDERKERRQYVENKLAEMYEKIEINDRVCLRLPDGQIIHVDTMGAEFDCLVVEYADDLEQARLNKFEDGDLFPMYEYDAEEMLKKIIAEIEDSTLTFTYSLY